MPAYNWDDNFDRDAARREVKEETRLWWDTPAASYPAPSTEQHHEAEMDRLFGESHAQD